MSASAWRRTPTHLALAALFLLGLGPSCGGERKTPPPTEQAALGGEVAARVGGDTIPLSLVVKVAEAQRITPREALGHLIDDAICAYAARTRGLDREEPAKWLLTAARGRATADRILAEATQAGPATDVEIEQLTQQYWREVDRPPAVRVVHALARKSDPKKPDAAADARARAFAPELRAAVVDARDVNDFITKAKALPHPGVEVIAENLPSGITEDGAIIDAAGQMDPAFAKGAFTLHTPGETSQIVESNFGWHVIRLVELVPEERMALEGRRLAFANEVTMNRAHTATEARLNVLRAANPVQIATTAELLTRSLGSAKPNPAP